jgi:hypothetical protein
LAADSIGGCNTLGDRLESRRSTTDWCRRAGGCGYVADKIPDYQRSILIGEV